MPKPAPTIPKDAYRYLTQRPLNCLVFILPLLAIFHIGTWLWGTDLLAPRDIHRILRYFGATAGYLPAVTVVVVLLLQHAVGRLPWSVQPLALAGMLGESVVGIVPLIAINHITGKMLMHAATAGPAAASTILGQQIATGIGAAVYEEFLFRMLLIGLLMLLLVDVFGLDKDIIATVAILVTACVFSLYHFPLETLTRGPFPWKEFTFRALAGAYLGVLYVLRGLGVAVGTHAFFNIQVALISM